MSTIRFRNARTGEIVTRLSEPIDELASRAKRERGHDAVLSGPAEVRFTWDEIAEDDGGDKRGQDGAADMAQEDDLWDEGRAEGQEDTGRDDHRDGASLPKGQGSSKGDAETTYALHSIFYPLGLLIFLYLHVAGCTLLCQSLESSLLLPRSQYLRALPLMTSP